LSVDDALLLGRIAFVAALYAFLLLLALLLRRELKAKGARSSERAPADLLVVEPFDTGLDPGERIPLLAVSAIGRGDDNDIVLNDSFLSNDHALLSWNGSGWVIEDLKSTNGTKLNGNPVTRPSPVKTGDSIELGRVRVKLVSL
jgi:FHA domain